MHQAMILVNMDRDIAAARAIWDAVDPTDFYQLVLKAWHRTTLDIGGPNAQADLLTLRNATAENPSLMVAAMAGQAETIAAMQRGDFPRAVEHSRAAIDAAERLRSTFFVYTNLIGLSLAASAADGLNADDLALVERCLHEQQTGGLEADQWSTLLCLAPELWRRGEHALARDIHAGSTRSPLGQSPMIGIVELFVPQLRAPSTSDAEPPALGELTNRAIDAITATPIA
jgi:hypothetical protein